MSRNEQAGLVQLLRGTLLTLDGDGSLPADTIVVLGATASGKTRLGVGLARALGGEIISADSRQVFCGMDLGTGKDRHEYGEVPVHLLDVVDPGLEFSVFHFQRMFLDCYHQVRLRGRLPVVVGGTGLYLDAVLHGYRFSAVPENPALRQELMPLSLEELVVRLRSLVCNLHNTTDLLDRDRVVRAIEIAAYQAEDSETEPLPQLKPVVFGIRWDRSELRKRITLRLKERLEQGMMDEIRNLLALGVPEEALDRYGLEYRYGVRYLNGTLSFNDMFQKLNSAIHDFAKRQDTWFRRMERNGLMIHWVSGSRDPLAEAFAILKACGKG